MLIESNTLREIEKGYEAKYKLDEERRFKAACRRNKLFGIWIGEHLGLSGDAAVGYAGPSSGSASNILVGTSSSLTCTKNW